MAFQLVELGGGVGYFKGGVYGNAGTGKTHTATLFALGIKKQLGLKGRIGFFDTETGVEYVTPMVLKETGEKPIGAKSRALSDAIAFLQECEKQGVAVAIVDSVTHIWEEVQKSLLKQINEKREKKGQNPKASIEWNDRGPLNDIWQRFTDAYINSKLHIILCGRAANLWEMTVNDEGKKELNRVGTKMKTQSDMAYEPAFLAEMEREQMFVDGKQVIVRTMTVLKDRFRLLDGKQFENPTFEAIKPHIDMLTPGAVNAIDTTRETDLGVNEEGDAEWSKERKLRAIYCEEVQGLLLANFPGQSAPEKLAKSEIVFAAFGTRSWTAVESMNSDRLKAGLDALPAIIHGWKDANGRPVEAAKTDADKVVAHFSDDKKAIVKAGKNGGAK